MKQATSLKSLLAISTLFVGLTASSISLAATYMVTGVAADDNLNVRLGPGTAYNVVTSIPPNGNGIGSNDEEVVSGSNTWVRVSWQGTDGWVNKRYLMDMTGYTYPELGKSQRKQKQYDYQVSTRAVAGDAHTHPAIPGCTDSIQHTHAGPQNHKHRYSCKNNAQRPKPAPAPAPRTQGGTPHTHPAIPNCTDSIQHTHPGNPKQQHRYSCKNNAPQARPAPAPRRAQSGNAHTHPAVPGCTNSIQHTHAGNPGHKHRYSCKKNAVASNTRVYNKSGQYATLPTQMSYDKPSHDMKGKNQPKIPASIYQ